MMREANVGSVVITNGEVVVGIVTDRDLVERVLASDGDAATPVANVMTHDVVCAHEDDDILTAANHMATRACRRLPVVDDDGRLRGMVSLDDLVMALARPMNELARAIGIEVLPKPSLVGLI
jgi:CBS domain-containing protein